MRTSARLLAGLLACVVALVFMVSDANLDIRDSLRPCRGAQLQSSAGPCAALAVKQLEQQQEPDTDTPPVVASSPLSCELGDAVVYPGEARFCGHSWTDETRDGRAFNPCAPARAGPSL